MLRRLPAHLIRSPSGRSDLASLEERLGLLLLVRVGLAAAIVVAAALASGELGMTITQAGPPTALYVALTFGTELIGRAGRRAALAAHRVMLPLDAVYLVAMTVPAGGPRSQLIVLFSLHLVAVTLLGSARSALRIALWDTFLFILVTTLGLATRIGELLGVRDVASPIASDTALAIMGFWAVAICTAAFSTVSERELRRNRNELEALATMTAALEVTTVEAAAYRIFLAHTTGALGFERGALLVPAGPSLVAHANRKHLPAAVTEVEVPSGPPDAVVRRVRAEHRPLALRSLDRTGDPVAAALLPGARNIVAIALGAGADAPVLVVEHGGRMAGERLARRTLLVVGQFVAHAVLALANITALADQERLAAVDGLTGLANRRQFDATLTREVGTALRRNEPMTLVLIDIDHFKAVNDSFGHLAGDEVLKALALVLRGACRDNDVVARFGGEEFALILPSCGSAAALGVLRRAGVAMRASDDLHEITISAGVATVLEHAVDETSLLAAADEALYSSKRSGRDRATVAPRAKTGELPAPELRRLVDAAAPAQGPPTGPGTPAPPVTAPPDGGSGPDGEPPTGGGARTERFHPLPSASSSGRSDRI